MAHRAYYGWQSASEWTSDSSSNSESESEKDDRARKKQRRVGASASDVSVKATNSKGELLTVARTEKKMITRIGEAVQIAKDASELGHPDAMAVLSDMHLYGVGVEKNEEESVRLMTLLAKRGKHARSMYVRGLRLLSDEKLRANGFSWLKKAEEAGSHEAAILLDFLFQEGTVNNVIRIRGGGGATYDIFCTKEE